MYLRKKHNTICIYCNQKTIIFVADIFEISNERNILTLPYKDNDASLETRAMLIIGYDSDKHAFEVANSSPICVFLIIILINTSFVFCLLHNEQLWEPPREIKKLIVRKLREIRTHASLHKTCFFSSFRVTQLLPL